MAKKKKDDAVTDEEETKVEEKTETQAGAEEISTEAELDSENGKQEQEDEELAAEPGLEEQLELARQEAAQNLDKWQRAVAELANFRRRQEEQRKLQRDRIKSEVLAGVISALDDMDLAFQNLPEELDGQLVGWVEGFRLVQRKLDRILDEQNVMSIDTNGDFDPNFHEAVSYEASDAHETDQIIAELRKGYQIGSRIIRPALVRVAS